MAMTLAYLFEDRGTGRPIVSRRRGTLEAIRARPHLSPIMETGVLVDDADIGGETPGFTAINFKPATGPYALSI
jgi:hypothetical protein